MNNRWNIRRRWLWIPFLGIGFVLLFGWITMWLWNAVLVPGAHFSPLTYWQGVGLLLLAKLLFGRMGGRPGGFRGRREWKQKWSSMTDEEKIKFRQEWKQKCGPLRSDSRDATAEKNSEEEIK